MYRGPSSGNWMPLPEDSPPDPKRRTRPSRRLALSQDFPQLLLLLRRQRGWELDVVLDDEVAVLTGLLGDGHAEPGVRIGASRLCRTALLNAQVLSVDRCNSSFPPSQRLFEAELDVVDQIVAFSREERVRFLSMLATRARTCGGISLPPRRRMPNPAGRLPLDRRRL